MKGVACVFNDKAQTLSPDMFFVFFLSSFVPFLYSPHFPFFFLSWGVVSALVSQFDRGV